MNCRITAATAGSTACPLAGAYDQSEAIVGFWSNGSYMAGRLSGSTGPSLRSSTTPITSMKGVDRVGAYDNCFPTASSPG